MSDAANERRRLGKAKCLALLVLAQARADLAWVGEVDRATSVAELKAILTRFKAEALEHRNAHMREVLDLHARRALLAEAVRIEGELAQLLAWGATLFPPRGNFRRR